VILDVVYNHTAESDHTGPTLSYRGIDNATYYRLDPIYPARYLNFTGTGNTLNLQERPVMRMVLDNLRYWVDEMHVDGFRFDLAASLGRGGLDFDPRSSFLDAIYQDRVLSQVKLIAEPWDLGPDGYVTGRFLAPWSEWNDRYRDDMRRYWRGDETQASLIARRLTGSPDLFATGERSPQAAINFVTCHDGFTLHDLVSYTQKHNRANGEENRDGTPENFSHNFGVEGPTNDRAIIAAREQQKRNLLATLLLSQGVPMLLGGDEIGRTQRGNNNAYNQDNPTSWYDWKLDEDKRALLEFTARLIAIRHRHPNLRRRAFLDGRLQEDGEAPRVRWLREDGEEMTDSEWQAPWYRCFALFLGAETGELDRDGEPLRDDPLLLILNASGLDVDFSLPAGMWSLAVDTARPEVAEDAEIHSSGATYTVAACSLALLRGSEQP
jgi:glycogen operon protein